MTRKELNGFRRVLDKRRAELESEDTSRGALAIETSPDELDRIQLAGEREIAIGNLERDYNVLRDIKAALRRIETNTFGICLDCQGEISTKRLNAVPWTSSCLSCQEYADGAQVNHRTGMDALLKTA